MIEELTRRFGSSWRDWAFVCPQCGDVATGADFEVALREAKILDENGRPPVDRFLGQECIGRVSGALRMSSEHWSQSGGRGCDWCAYGLFRGPDILVLPDGREVGAFKIADAPVPVAEAGAE
jgi:hypothetical protein